MWSPQTYLKHVNNKKTHTEPRAEAGGMRSRFTGVMSKRINSLTSNVLVAHHATKTVQEQQQITETLMVLMACQERKWRHVELCI